MGGLSDVHLSELLTTYAQRDSSPPMKYQDELISLFVPDLLESNSDRVLTGSTINDQNQATATISTYRDLNAVFSLQRRKIGKAPCLYPRLWGRSRAVVPQLWLPERADRVETLGRRFIRDGQ
jgi:hypothetical protein